MKLKVRLKVSYSYNQYNIRITFRAGNIYPGSVYVTTGEGTWLAKLARKILMDGKICTIERGKAALTFEIDELGIEFIKCAKELGSDAHKLWKESYEKLEDGTPLEEVMQEIVAQTLGSVLSKDLEEENGS